MTVKAEAQRDFFKKYLPYILGIFLIIQPVLDALTAPAAKAGISITVGVIVRTLFLMLAFFYTAFFSRFEKKKTVVAYMTALVAFLLCFAVHMYTLGGISLIIANCKELVKVVFVPFVALLLYAVYAEYGFCFPHYSVAISCGLYSFIILFAFLTNTSMPSYRSGYGYCGWFYAANEVSSIIAIAAPVLMWYCLDVIRRAEKKTWYKTALAVLGLVSVVFAATFIGTKIVYLVVLLYAVAAGIWCVVFSKKYKNKQNKLLAIVSLILIVAMFAVFPISPLNVYMQNIYFSYMGMTSDELVTDRVDMYAGLEEVQEELRVMNEATSGTWLRELIASNNLVAKIDAVLSRRLLTASPVVQEYTDGGIMTKLFGTGYVTSDANNRYIGFMIELDGLGILMRLGIVGFLLCFMPYIILIVYAIVRFFKSPKKRLASLGYCSYLYGALAAFGIAFIAGHVAVSPAVGIFMLAVTSKTYFLSREEPKEIMTVE